MNLASCTELVHLTLNHTSFSDEWIEDLLLSVPLLLESLTLNGCSGFKQLNVSNQRWKCIVLRSTSENRNISLDTPNLVSLTFEGCIWVNFSMKAPSLIKANLKLIHFSKYSIKDWFLDLINFIKHFDCSRSLSLHVWPQKALIIPKTLRKKCNPPLPNIKHLKVWIQDRDGPLKEAKLRDSMLWCAPSVEALSVEQ